jgi:hypothetical protein
MIIRFCREALVGQRLLMEIICVCEQWLPRYFIEDLKTTRGKHQ